MRIFRDCWGFLEIFEKSVFLMFLGRISSFFSLWIFDNSGLLLSVWIGKKVTAMISNEERIILRKIRNL